MAYEQNSLSVNAKANLLWISNTPLTSQLSNFNMTNCSYLSTLQFLLSNEAYKNDHKKYNHYLHFHWRRFPIPHYLFSSLLSSFLPPFFNLFLFLALFFFPSFQPSLLCFSFSFLASILLFLPSLHHTPNQASLLRRLKYSRTLPVRLTSQTRPRHHCLGVP